MVHRDVDGRVGRSFVARLGAWTTTPPKTRRVRRDGTSSLRVAQCRAMHRSWNRRRQHSAVRVSAFGPSMDREHTAQDSSSSPIPRARICRWCRDSNPRNDDRYKFSPRKRSPRRAGNDARCRRGEKIGSGKVRFVMSGRDVFLIAPHTGPSTPRPRESPRERCFRSRCGRKLRWATSAWRGRPSSSSGAP